MSQIYKGYGAYTTTNEYGQRGNLVSVHDTKDQANKAALSIGWYGGSGDVEELSVVIEGNTIRVGKLTEISLEQCQMMAALTLKQKKEAARKKLQYALTKEEAELLGIKQYGEEP